MDLRWRDVLKLRLRALFRRARADADLTEELQFHVDQQIEEYVAGGMSRDEARTLALRRIGTLDVQRERCRDARGVNWINHILRDVLGGMRLLKRDRGFTTVAILSLALGIGANATIFQLLDSLRLRSLPVVDPGRLVIVDVANRAWTAGDYSGRYAAMTSSLFERILANSEPFSGILAWSQTTMDLATRGESRFVENGLYVRRRDARLPDARRRAEPYVLATRVRSGPNGNRRFPHAQQPAVHDRRRRGARLSRHRCRPLLRPRRAHLCGRDHQSRQHTADRWNELVAGHYGPAQAGLVAGARE